MRICILTQADNLTWIQHYVDAFRQRGKVITVGPGVTAKYIQDWGLEPVAQTMTPNDVEVDLMPDMDLAALLPPGWQPDLIVSITNGAVSLRPMIHALACPSACITVDTWQSVSDYVECQQFDFVFPVQKAFAPKLEAAGGSRVQWIPLGCNPDAHYPVDTPPQYDIAFAGSVVLPFHQRRYQLLQQLEQRFSVHIASKVYHDALCRAMGNGRLAFNRSAIDDVNMRVFEVMAMGRPLLTNRDSENNGLLDLFQEDRDLIVYSDADELVAKTEYYLAHPEARETIARNGMDRVRSQHRYIDRVDQILAIVDDAVPGFDRRQGLRRTAIDDAMANLTPFGARRAVDAGGRLAPHRAALGARGVESIDDATSAFAKSGEVDVVAANSTSELAGDCPAALGRAYAMLVPGGTLLVRLGAGDFSRATGITSLDKLENVFAEHGFHVTHCEMDGVADILVRARKRTRQLLEIVQESCEQFPFLDVDGLTRWAASYGPNY